MLTPARDLLVTGLFIPCLRGCLAGADSEASGRAYGYGGSTIPIGEHHSRRSIPHRLRMV